MPTKWPISFVESINRLTLSFTIFSSLFNTLSHFLYILTKIGFLYFVHFEPFNRVYIIWSCNLLHCTFAICIDIERGDNEFVTGDTQWQTIFFHKFLTLILLYKIAFQSFYATYKEDYLTWQNQNEWKRRHGLKWCGPAYVYSEAHLYLCQCGEGNNMFENIMMG